MKSSPTALPRIDLQQGDDLARRGAPGAGQAGAVDRVYAGAVAAGEAARRPRPRRAVEPPAPKRAPSSLISVSAKKLSE